VTLVSRANEFDARRRWLLVRAAVIAMSKKAYRDAEPSEQRRIDQWQRPVWDTQEITFAENFLADGEAAQFFRETPLDYELSLGYSPAMKARAVAEAFAGLHILLMPDDGRPLMDVLQSAWGKPDDDRMRRISQTLLLQMLAPHGGLVKVPFLSDALMTAEGQTWTTAALEHFRRMPNDELHTVAQHALIANYTIGLRFLPDRRIRAEGAMDMLQTEHLELSGVNAAGPATPPLQGASPTQPPSSAPEKVQDAAPPSASAAATVDDRMKAIQNAVKVIQSIVGSRHKAKIIPALIEEFIKTPTAQGIAKACRNVSGLPTLSWQTIRGVLLAQGLLLRPDAESAAAKDAKPVWVDLLNSCMTAAFKDLAMPAEWTQVRNLLDAQLAPMDPDVDRLAGLFSGSVNLNSAGRTDRLLTFSTRLNRYLTDHGYLLHVGADSDRTIRSSIVALRTQETETWSVEPIHGRVKTFRAGKIYGDINLPDDPLIVTGVGVLDDKNHYERDVQAYLKFLKDTRGYFDAQGRSEDNAVDKNTLAWIRKAFPRSEDLKSLAAEYGAAHHLSDLMGQAAFQTVLWESEKEPSGKGLLGITGPFAGPLSHFIHDYLSKPSSLRKSFQDPGASNQTDMAMHILSAFGVLNAMATVDRPSLIWVRFFAEARAKELQPDRDIITAFFARYCAPDLVKRKSEMGDRMFSTLLGERMAQFSETELQGLASQVLADNFEKRIEKSDKTLTLKAVQLPGDSFGQFRAARLVEAVRQILETKSVNEAAQIRLKELEGYLGPLPESVREAMKNIERISGLSDHEQYRVLFRFLQALQKDYLSAHGLMLFEDADPEMRPLQWNLSLARFDPADDVIFHTDGLEGEFRIHDLLGYLTPQLQGAYVWGYDREGAFDRSQEIERIRTAEMEVESGADDLLTEDPLNLVQAANYHIRKWADVLLGHGHNIQETIENVLADGARSVITNLILQQKTEAIRRRIETVVPEEDKEKLVEVYDAGMPPFMMTSFGIFAQEYLVPQSPVDFLFQSGIENRRHLHDTRWPLYAKARAVTQVFRELTEMAASARPTSVLAPEIVSYFLGLSVNKPAITLEQAILFYLVQREVNAAADLTFDHFLGRPDIRASSVLQLSRILLEQNDQELQRIAQRILAENFKLQLTYDSADHVQITDLTDEYRLGEILGNAFDDRQLDPTLWPLFNTKALEDLIGPVTANVRKAAEALLEPATDEQKLARLIQLHQFMSLVNREMLAPHGFILRLRPVEANLKIIGYSPKVQRLERSEPEAYQISGLLSDSIPVHYASADDTQNKAETRGHLQTGVLVDRTTARFLGRKFHEFVEPEFLSSAGMRANPTESQPVQEFFMKVKVMSGWLNHAFGVSSTAEDIEKTLERTGRARDLANVVISLLSAKHLKNRDLDSPEGQAGAMGAVYGNPDLEFSERYFNPSGPAASWLALDPSQEYRVNPIIRQNSASHGLWVTLQELRSVPDARQSASVYFGKLLFEERKRLNLSDALLLHLMMEKMIRGYKTSSSRLDTSARLSRLLEFSGRLSAISEQDLGRILREIDEENFSLSMEVKDHQVILTDRAIKQPPVLDGTTGLLEPVLNPQSNVEDDGGQWRVASSDKWPLRDDMAEQMFKVLQSGGSTPSGQLSPLLRRMKEIFNLPGHGQILDTQSSKYPRANAQDPGQEVMHEFATFFRDSFASCTLDLKEWARHKKLLQNQLEIQFPKSVDEAAILTSAKTKSDDRFAQYQKFDRFLRVLNRDALIPAGRVVLLDVLDTGKAVLAVQDWARVKHHQAIHVDGFPDDLLVLHTLGLFGDSFGAHSTSQLGVTLSEDGLYREARGILQVAHTPGRWDWLVAGARIEPWLHRMYGESADAAEIARVNTEWERLEQITVAVAMRLSEKDYGKSSKDERNNYAMGGTNYLDAAQSVPFTERYLNRQGPLWHLYQTLDLQSEDAIPYPRLYMARAIPRVYGLLNAMVQSEKACRPLGNIFANFFASLNDSAYLPMADVLLLYEFARKVDPEIPFNPRELLQEKPNTALVKQLSDHLLRVSDEDLKRMAQEILHDNFLIETAIDGDTVHLKTEVEAPSPVPEAPADEDRPQAVKRAIEEIQSGLPDRSRKSVIPALIEQCAKTPTPAAVQKVLAKSGLGQISAQKVLDLLRKHGLLRTPGDEGRPSLRIQPPVWYESLSELLTGDSEAQHWKNVRDSLKSHLGPVPAAVDEAFEAFIASPKGPERNFRAADFVLKLNKTYLVKAGYVIRVKEKGPGVLGTTLLTINSKPVEIYVGEKLMTDVPVYQMTGSFGLPVSDDDGFPPGIGLILPLEKDTTEPRLYTEILAEARALQVQQNLFGAKVMAMSDRDRMNVTLRDWVEKAYGPKATKVSIEQTEATRRIRGVALAATWNLAQEAYLDSTAEKRASWDTDTDSVLSLAFSDLFLRLSPNLESNLNPWAHNVSLMTFWTLTTLTITEKPSTEILKLLFDLMAEKLNYSDQSPESTDLLFGQLAMRIAPELVSESASMNLDTLIELARRLHALTEDELRGLALDVLVSNYHVTIRREGHTLTADPVEESEPPLGHYAAARLAEAVRIILDTNAMPETALIRLHDVQGKLGPWPVVVQNFIDILSHSNADSESARHETTWGFLRVLQEQYLSQHGIYLSVNSRSTPWDINVGYFDPSESRPYHVPGWDNPLIVHRLQGILTFGLQPSWAAGPGSEAAVNPEAFEAQIDLLKDMMAEGVAVEDTLSKSEPANLAMQLAEQGRKWAERQAGILNDYSGAVEQVSEIGFIRALTKLIAGELSRQEAAETDSELQATWDTTRPSSWSQDFRPFVETFMAGEIEDIDVHQKILQRVFPNGDARSYYKAEAITDFLVLLMAVKASGQPALGIGEVLAKTLLTLSTGEVILSVPTALLMFLAERHMSPESKITIDDFFADLQEAKQRIVDISRKLIAKTDTQLKALVDDMLIDNFRLSVEFHPDHRVVITDNRPLDHLAWFFREAFRNPSISLDDWKEESLSVEQWTGAPLPVPVGTAAAKLFQPGSDDPTLGRYYRMYRFVELLNRYALAPKGFILQLTPNEREDGLGWKIGETWRAEIRRVNSQQAAEFRIAGTEFTIPVYESTSLLDSHIGVDDHMQAGILVNAAQMQFYCQENLKANDNASAIVAQESRSNDRSDDPTLEFFNAHNQWIARLLGTTPDPVGYARMLRNHEIIGRVSKLALGTLGDHSVQADENASDATEQARLYSAIYGLPTHFAESDDFRPRSPADQWLRRPIRNKEIDPERYMARSRAAKDLFVHVQQVLNAEDVEQAVGLIMLQILANSQSQRGFVDGDALLLYLIQEKLGIANIGPLDIQSKDPKDFPLFEINRRLLSMSRQDLLWLFRDIGEDSFALSMEIKEGRVTIIRTGKPLDAPDSMNEALVQMQKEAGKRGSALTRPMVEKCVANPTLQNINKVIAPTGVQLKPQRVLDILKSHGLLAAKKESPPPPDDRPLGMQVRSFIENVVKNPHQWEPEIWKRAKSNWERKGAKISPRIDEAARMFEGMPSKPSAFDYYRDIYEFVYRINMDLLGPSEEVLWVRPERGAWEITRFDVDPGPKEQFAIEALGESLPLFVHRNPDRTPLDTLSTPMFGLMVSDHPTSAILAARAQGREILAMKAGPSDDKLREAQALIQNLTRKADVWAAKAIAESANENDFMSESRQSQIIRHLANLTTYRLMIRLFDVMPDPWRAEMDRQKSDPRADTNNAPFGDALVRRDSPLRIAAQQIRERRADPKRWIEPRTNMLMPAAWAELTSLRQTRSAHQFIYILLYDLAAAEFVPDKLTNPEDPMTLYLLADAAAPGEYTPDDFFDSQRVAATIERFGQLVQGSSQEQLLAYAEQAYRKNFYLQMRVDDHTIKLDADPDMPFLGHVALTGKLEESFLDEHDRQVFDTTVSRLIAGYRKANLQVDDLQYGQGLDTDDAAELILKQERQRARAAVHSDVLGEEGSKLQTHAPRFVFMIMVKAKAMGQLKAEMESGSHPSVPQEDNRPLADQVVSYVSQLLIKGRWDNRLWDIAKENWERKAGRPLSTRIQEAAEALFQPEIPEWAKHHLASMPGSILIEPAKSPRFFRKLHHFIFEVNTHLLGLGDEIVDVDRKPDDPNDKTPSKFPIVPGDITRYEIVGMNDEIPVYRYRGAAAETFVGITGSAFGILDPAQLDQSLVLQLRNRMSGTLAAKNPAGHSPEQERVRETLTKMLQQYDEAIASAGGEEAFSQLDLSAQRARQLGFMTALRLADRAYRVMPDVWQEKVDKKTPRPFPTVEGTPFVEAFMRPAGSLAKIIQELRGRPPKRRERVEPDPHQLPPRLFGSLHGISHSQAPRSFVHVLMAGMSLWSHDPQMAQDPEAAVTLFLLAQKLDPDAYVLDDFLESARLDQTLERMNATVEVVSNQKLREKANEILNDNFYIYLDIEDQKIFIRPSADLPMAARFALAGRFSLDVLEPKDQQAVQEAARKVVEAVEKEGLGPLEEEMIQISRHFPNEAAVPEPRMTVEKVEKARRLVELMMQIREKVRQESGTQITEELFHRLVGTITDAEFLRLHPQPKAVPNRDMSPSALAKNITAFLELVFEKGEWNQSVWERERERWRQKVAPWPASVDRAAAVVAECPPRQQNLPPPPGVKDLKSAVKLLNEIRDRQFYRDLFRLVRVMDTDLLGPRGELLIELPEEKPAGRLSWSPTILHVNPGETERYNVDGMDETIASYELTQPPAGRTDIASPQFGYAVHSETQREHATGVMYMAARLHESFHGEDQITPVHPQYNVTVGIKRVMTKWFDRAFGHDVTAASYTEANRVHRRFVLLAIQIAQRLSERVQEAIPGGWYEVNSNGTTSKSYWDYQPQPFEDGFVKKEGSLWKAYQGLKEYAKVAPEIDAREKSNAITAVFGVLEAMALQGKPSLVLSGMFLDIGNMIATGVWRYDLWNRLLLYLLSQQVAPNELALADFLDNRRIANAVVLLSRHLEGLSDEELLKRVETIRRENFHVYLELSDHTIQIIPRLYIPFMGRLGMSGRFAVSFLHEEDQPVFLNAVNTMVKKCREYGLRAAQVRDHVVERLTRNTSAGELLTSSKYMHALARALVGLPEIKTPLRREFFDQFIAQAAAERMEDQEAHSESIYLLPKPLKPLGLVSLGWVEESAHILANYGLREGLKEIWRQRSGLYDGRVTLEMRVDRRYLWSLAAGPLASAAAALVLAKFASVAGLDHMTGIFLSIVSAATALRLLADFTLLFFRPDHELKPFLEALRSTWKKSRTLRLAFQVSSVLMGLAAGAVLFIHYGGNYGVKSSLAAVMTMGGTLLVSGVHWALRNPPAGFRYIADFLSPEEEQTISQQLEQVAFQPLLLHGVKAKRDVAQFGYAYRYGTGRRTERLAPTAPMPEFITALREKAAAAAGVPAEDFDQVLINRYPAGAGIGWHTDSPSFGEVILGISIGAPALMQLRRKARKIVKNFSVWLEPRSLYVLSGTARNKWEHSVNAAEGLRYSITFRMKKTEAPPADSTSPGGTPPSTPDTGSGPENKDVLSAA